MPRYVVILKTLNIAEVEVEANSPEQAKNRAIWLVIEEQVNFEPVDGIETAEVEELKKVD